MNVLMHKGKPSEKKSLAGGGWIRGVSSQKKAKMISGSFRAFLFFLVFSLFFRGGSNPKAGGWILDFARDV